jgi:hypothetical protein
MIATSITAPVELTSSGATTVLSLTPSTDAGSSVVLETSGTFENLATLEVTWGDGTNGVTYNNTEVGDSSVTWEIRAYANSYGDGSWGLTLVVVFDVNAVVIDTFNGPADVPLEFTVNPGFDGSGNFTVLTGSIKQDV